MSKNPQTPPTESSGSNLPKAYDPSAIEQRWADYWLAEGLWDVPTPAHAPEPGAHPFTMLLPPPNVTGRLHMGHMLNQTEMDVLTRWHRMRGETALWVPGTDHAGIATQMMVERQLRAEGVCRQRLGREKFVERVWQWKQEYGSAITDQMRRLGASVDWSRTYFTMDERLSTAVKEAFVRLYEQGLIYRGAYIVNWDPVQQTAVSDLEVTHEERMGKLYQIRYPFADGTGSVVVATTRPETMLGDVAVAVNPEDERYQECLGKLLTLPLSAAAGRADREIPVIADEWANPEFGTGAVKVTPAHDPNDFAIGQRHSLAQPVILDEQARISLPGSPYHGMERYAARERIVADLEAAGLLVAVKDHAMAIAVSQRSGAVIEPRLSMQWFLAVNQTPKGGTDRASIAENAIFAVSHKHIRFTPEMYEKTYMEWMNNIHDWCISRQLWWGHRIPAWHCAACQGITVSRGTPTSCEHCGSERVEQSTDVLDTWFSSGLLPFTVFGWPGKQIIGNTQQEIAETITRTAVGESKYLRQVGGQGNYGHVKLRISPNERGKGFTFSNNADPAAVPKRFIRPIEESIREALRGGVVEGHSLVDVNVSLIDGSYHEIDSNEMAFRIAASDALKEAALKAGPIAFDDPTLEIAHLSGHGHIATLEPESANLTADLAAFYPTSLLVTGFDILFFWVARMIMLGCHFMLDVPMPDGSQRTLADAVPFREVYIHALVRDANREKMSKTKGNVIDPIEIITRYGTDAVRFTLASQASPGTDIAFSEARTEGYRAFANKIWNAARFLLMNLERAKEAGIRYEYPDAPFMTGGGAGLDPVAFDHSITGKIANFVAATTPAGEAALATGNIDSANPSVGAPMGAVAADAAGAELPLESRWIMARLSETAGAVNASLGEYRFDEAASHVYQFFWGDLCDWYLEIVKLRLNFDDAAQQAETSAALTTLVRVFEAALRLLSPLMPFLTEEIWHALYEGKPPAHASGKVSIALARFPQAEDYPADGEAIRDMAVLQELITTVRALRKEMGVPEKESAPILVHGADRITTLAKQNGNMLSRLARVSEVKLVPEAPTGGNARSTASFDVAVVYERQIDVAAERERLTKELAKYEKQLAANEARLGDTKFIDKAPAHIVDGMRKQTEETRGLYEKAKAALESLPSA